MGSLLPSTNPTCPKTIKRVWMLLNLFCFGCYFVTLSILILQTRAVIGFALAPTMSPGMIRARAFRWSRSPCQRTSWRCQGEGPRQNDHFSRKIQRPSRPGAATSSELSMYSGRNDIFDRQTRIRLFASIANATRSSPDVVEGILNDNAHSVQEAILIESSNSLSQSTFDERVLGDRTRTETSKKALETSDEDSSYLLDGLTSRPVPGGNWNVKAPTKWAEDFGRRSPEYDDGLRSKIQLRAGDEGYYDVSDIKVPKATIVRTKEQARKVMKVLMNADVSILHACDTEVMDIDLKEVGPVGNGYVTCVSIYSGPDFDYGLGDGPGTALWIDNLDDAVGVIDEFKPWFQDPTKLKVWHNYGFDRHVMWNEGINCLGFGGDTMHMARLQDTSRAKNSAKPGQGYSLEALTAELLNMRKRPMKEIFGVKRLRKDGTEGSLVDVPPVQVLQRDPQFRANFIMYSCYDAEGTWRLHEILKSKLQQLPWVGGKNLYDYYWDNMREFGHVLTDMERRGIRVDAKNYLASVERQARKDREEHSENFRRWAARQIGPDGLALNPASSLQLGTFLFGGALNSKTREETERERVFKVAREEVPEIALEAYRQRDEAASSKGKNGEFVATC